MELSTKQLKQIIKEELQSLLNESDEIQQMAQLISGDDVQSVKSGLNQLVIGGVADMLGVRIIDIIKSDADINRDLLLHVKWLEKVVNLKKAYHSEEIVDKTLPDWSREDTRTYAKQVKDIIEEFWWNLSKMWSQKEQSEFLPGNIWQATQDWSSSYAGDVLIDIAEGKMIYGSDYYGHPARTPKPGEDSFVTGFFATQEWLTSILLMMREDQVFEQLLRELQ